jgi:hypothetical protein
MVGRAPAEQVHGQRFESRQVDVLHHLHHPLAEAGAFIMPVP